MWVLMLWRGSLWLSDALLDLVVAEIYGGLLNLCLGEPVHFFGSGH